MNSCSLRTSSLFLGKNDLVTFVESEQNGEPPADCAHASPASPFSVSRLKLSNIKTASAMALTGRPMKLGTYYLCYCGAKTVDGVVTDDSCADMSDFSAIGNKIIIRGPNQDTIPLAYCVSSLDPTVQAGGCNSWTVDDATGILPKPFQGNALSADDKFFFIEKTEDAVCG